MQIVESVVFRPASGFYDPEQLYCDGGLIGSNGNNKGGTWACRLVSKGLVVRDSSGLVFKADVGACDVTNNLTEFLALVRALRLLPFDWRGTIWSDSKITLGRVFCNWHISNIPDDFVNDLENEKARLVHWNQIHYGLLDGHPTAVHLATGAGKRGHPVSEHNRWCDKECGRLARRFLGGAK